MDFPLDLNRKSWVTEVAELEQVIKLVLKNPVHMWLQSYTFGSLVSLHSTSQLELETNIRETLKKIKGIQIKSVIVINNTVTVKLSYNKRDLEYSIELN